MCKDKHSQIWGMQSYKYLITQVSNLFEKNGFALSVLVHHTRTHEHGVLTIFFLVEGNDEISISSHFEGERKNENITQSSASINVLEVIGEQVCQTWACLNQKEAAFYFVPENHCGVQSFCELLELSRDTDSIPMVEYFSHLPDYFVQEVLQCEKTNTRGIPECFWYPKASSYECRLGNMLISEKIHGDVGGVLINKVDAIAFQGKEDEITYYTRFISSTYVVDSKVVIVQYLAYNKKRYTIEVADDVSSANPNISMFLPNDFESFLVQLENQIGKDFNHQYPFGVRFDECVQGHFPAEFVSNDVVYEIAQNFKNSVSAQKTREIQIGGNMVQYMRQCI